MQAAALLILCSLSFQPQDTGSVYVAELTGSTVPTQKEDLIGINYRAGGKKTGFTAGAQIPGHANPATKAAAIAQAINDDGENDNGDGDNPSPLVRAVAIGHTVSIVGVNGVSVEGVSFLNATQQRGCKVRKLTPKDTGQQRGAQNPGVLIKEPHSSWLFLGDFLGVGSDGQPSKVDFGVIEGPRERSFSLETRTGPPLFTCLEMVAVLEREGIPSEIFIPEGGGGAGVRLLLPQEGIFFGSDDVQSVLKATIH